MKTVIAEKPSVAKEIAKILGATQSKEGYMEGNGYYVTWAFGHLVALCMPEDYGIKGFVREALPIMPDPFQLTVQLRKTEKGEWKPDTGCQKQLKIIGSLFDKSEKIIVATDAGREGELIFRYIYHYLECKKPFERLWISSLTDKAIRDGFSSLKPGNEFDNLYLAAKARSEADWLIGLNASQAISIIAQSKGYSLGRVQTPTLSLVCRRYIENKGFKPQLYWVIKVATTTEKSFFFHSPAIAQKDQAEALVRSFDGVRSVVVTHVESKEVKQEPPLLFDLTALQKRANLKYNLSAQITLDVAQTLYERKLITYPRTGSCYISDDVFEGIPALIAKFTPNGFDRYNQRSVNAAKVTDHHALLPTGEQGQMNDLEQKIYGLIVNRLLEAFSDPCIKRVTQYGFKHRERPFLAQGEVVIYPGWRKISDEAEEPTAGDQEEDNQQLPDLVKDSSCPIGSVTANERQTRPKPLYTEASLLAAMEHAAKEVEDKAESSALKEGGLGTPATRAGIIEVLIKGRQYIERQGKSLVPTEKGLRVYQVVKDRRIADVGLTGQWELELDKISNGQRNVREFNLMIRDFCKQTTNDLLQLKQSDVATEVPFFRCPCCGQRAVRVYEKIAKCLAEGCDFKVFREICGKKITDQQVLDLLNSGCTKQIKGFKSKAGKEFSAALKIEKDGKVTFLFEEKIS